MTEWFRGKMKIHRFLRLGLSLTKFLGAGTAILNLKKQLTFNKPFEIIKSYVT